MNLIKGRYKEFCTVGQLKKFLEKHSLPDDAKILLHRIEDSYFEKLSMEVIKKEGEQYHLCKRLNDKIDSGEFSNKDNYPDLDNPEDYRTSTEVLEKIKDQYYPCWCPVKYPDDPNLYLDAHY